MIPRQVIDEDGGVDKRYRNYCSPSSLTTSSAMELATRSLGSAGPVGTFFAQEANTPAVLFTTSAGRIVSIPRSVRCNTTVSPSCNGARSVSARMP